MASGTEPAVGPLLSGQLLGDGPPYPPLLLGVDLSYTNEIVTTI